ncbi:N-terminal domain of NEFA-interacting nuclear protein NIP30 domain containing protein [Elaphomyces granulatus]
MSSGFVSGGTIGDPVDHDDEWRRAQQELEEERRQKAELGKQEGGKSLYEILQQNKMAKQEAFEESIRLKNQFRALDADEVEFLDSVLESTRAKEAAVKKETAEQLAVFHRQREEADRALLESASTDNAKASGMPGSPIQEEQWTVSGRKRKRNRKELLFAGKMRKSSATEEADSSPRRQDTDVKITGRDEEVNSFMPTTTSTASSPAVSQPKKSPLVKPFPNTCNPVVKPELADTDSAEEKKIASKALPVSLGLDGYSSDDD